MRYSIPPIALSPRVVDRASASACSCRWVWRVQIAPSAKYRLVESLKVGAATLDQWCHPNLPCQAKRRDAVRFAGNERTKVSQSFGQHDSRQRFVSTLFV